MTLPFLAFMKNYTIAFSITKIFWCILFFVQLPEKSNHSFAVGFILKSTHMDRNCISRKICLWCDHHKPSQLTFTFSKWTIKSTTIRPEICSKLTIRTSERRHIVVFELVSHLFSIVSIVGFEQVNASWSYVLAVFMVFMVCDHYTDILFTARPEWILIFSFLYICKCINILLLVIISAVKIKLQKSCSCMIYQYFVTTYFLLQSSYISFFYNTECSYIHIV